jgi:hypothetical protein
LIKASILFFYKRVFSTSSMKFSCRIVGSATAAWWAVATILSATQCRPVRKVWEFWMTEGACYELSAFLIGKAVPNIILNIIILGKELETLYTVEIRLTFV